MEVYLQYFTAVRTVLFHRRHWHKNHAWTLGVLIIHSPRHKAKIEGIARQPSNPIAPITTPKDQSARTQTIESFQFGHMSPWIQHKHLFKETIDLSEVTVISQAQLEGLAALQLSPINTIKPPSRVHQESLARAREVQKEDHTGHRIKHIKSTATTMRL